MITLFGAWTDFSPIYFSSWPGSGHNTLVKMSRLYDTVEPAVIDDDVLMKAVEEQGPKEEAGKIAKEEGIDFLDVTTLRLDFKSMWF